MTLTPAQLVEVWRDVLATMPKVVAADDEYAKGYAAGLTKAAEQLTTSLAAQAKVDAACPEDMGGEHDWNEDAVGGLVCGWCGVNR